MRTAPTFRELFRVCECEDVRQSDLLFSLEGDERTRTITHTRCGGGVLCEICALDGVDRFANTIHVGCVVCADHESVAINNVATRET